MRLSLSRALLVTALAATTLPALDGVAGAVGPGTYTAITTPNADVHRVYDVVTPSNNAFPVSGTASLDVTMVDIDCVMTFEDGTLHVDTFASNVPVSVGSFSTTATYPSHTLNCRLRAVPSGTDTSGYLGSYTGPVLYTNALAPTLDVSTPYTYQEIAEEGDGVLEAQDAGQCGVQVVASITRPAMTVGPVPTNCLLALTKGNLDPTGTSTKSSVTVDGHNAYLPYAVKYLRTGLGLTLTQTAVTTSGSMLSNGDFVITESSPLVRCSAGDTYPPTVGSCPSLTSTGVTFLRSIQLTRNGHQGKVRDTYTSTDALAHTLALEYQGTVQSPDTGRAGFTYPTHGSTFTASTLDQTVTGFGAAAGTMFERSDLYASSDDAHADTAGFTWSRPPSVIAFSHTLTSMFGMRYSLSVPASGKAFLGFAVSEGPTTAPVQALASQAVAEMVNAPTITTPAANAVIPSEATTVKGALTAGANGLPTSVLVNGHAAAITKTSATTATYAVTFTQAWGKHTITVVAKDAVGNTASRAVTATNSPALVLNGSAHRSSKTLTVPTACRTWATGTCYGKLVVKTTGGTTIGTSAIFTVAKGGTKNVAVTLKTIVSTVRVYLYQREPNGTYLLASSKSFSV